jgi:hypothetical protein
MLMCGAMLTGALEVCDEPANQADLAAYQAAKAQVGRDADAQVKLALWCEAHGLSAERLKHLMLATLLDPSHVAARGLLGLVAHRGKWERPEDVGRELRDDPARNALIQEYMKRRAKTPDKADDQWKLALWCEQNGLSPQATAHFNQVVKLDPKRDAAWRRLGFRKTSGRWVKPEIFTAEKADLEAQTRANKFWKPRLEHWREALSTRDKGKRAEAERALAQITDPRAVSMIWTVFARGDESRQRMAVRILSQIDAPGASRGLALFAVFSPSASIRQASKEILRRRDPREFAGLLVGMIREPIKYKIKKVEGPGSQGQLVIEGQKANLKRLYTPLETPTLMPGDLPGTDGNGQLVVSRVLDRYSTPSTLMRQADLASLYPAPTDPNRIARILGQAGMSEDQSKHIGQAVSVGSRTVLPQFSPDRRGYDVSREITESIQIPIGQMVQDAQASAEVAQQQLARDVQSLEDYNAPIQFTNRRVRETLTDVSGQDLGADLHAWEKWCLDLQGYAYRSPSTSADSFRQTVVEQVPLDYQPQVAPAILQHSASAPQVIAHHSCFAGGTSVRTLNGQRPIEDLREGDQLLTQDTTTGVLSFQPVITVYHNPPNATYRIDLGKEAIVATGIHRFWKAGQGWVMARDIKPGDRLRAVSGIMVVKSVASDKVQPVYNLQITGGDNFFVGEQGVLAHDNSLVNPTERPFDRVPAIDDLSQQPSRQDDHSYQQLTISAKLNGVELGGSLLRRP